MGSAGGHPRRDRAEMSRPWSGGSHGSSRSRQRQQRPGSSSLRARPWSAGQETTLGTLGGEFGFDAILDLYGEDEGGSSGSGDGDDDNGNADGTRSSDSDAEHDPVPEEPEEEEEEEEGEGEEEEDEGRTSRRRLVAVEAVLDAVPDVARAEWLESMAHDDTGQGTVGLNEQWSALAGGGAGVERRAPSAAEAVVRAANDARACREAVQNARDDVRWVGKCVLCCNPTSLPPTGCDRSDI